MLNNYEEAIQWLFKQFPSYQNIGAQAYKPGLENVRILLNRFNNPQNQLNLIHVAGTNGKGSTSSYISSYLTETGEKVGLFTSPHIYDFRERIRINGIKISELNVVEFCNQIIEAKLEFEPSFFEITFAMAINYFHQEKCSYCVIETGLGGRLDATNIISPKISIITNIGIDHTQFLGQTIKEIATEKAGIIKEKTPIVIGEFTSETKIVFEQIALRNNAKLLFAENEKLPLINGVSNYQLKNLRTALVSLKAIGIKIDNEQVQVSIHNLFKNTGLFGRLTEISKSPRIILDVSHNQDGIKATLNHLMNEIDGDFYVILGASSDKNLNEMIAYFPKNAIINLCEFKNERSYTFNELLNIQVENPQITNVFKNINIGIKEIKKQLTDNDTLLVIGSFFLIADVDLPHKF